MRATNTSAAVNHSEVQNWGLTVVDLPQSTTLTEPNEGHPLQDPGPELPSWRGGADQVCRVSGVAVRRCWQVDPPPWPGPSPATSAFQSCRPTPLRPLRRRRPPTRRRVRPTVRRAPALTKQPAQATALHRQLAPCSDDVGTLPSPPALFFSPPKSTKSSSNPPAPAADLAVSRPRQAKESATEVDPLELELEQDLHCEPPNGLVDPDLPPSPTAIDMQLKIQAQAVLPELARYLQQRGIQTKEQRSSLRAEGSAVGDSTLGTQAYYGEAAQPEEHHPATTTTDGCNGKSPSVKKSSHEIEEVLLQARAPSREKGKWIPDWSRGSQAQHTPGVDTAAAKIPHTREKRVAQSTRTQPHSDLDARARADEEEEGWTIVRPSYGWRKREDISRLGKPLQRPDNFGRSNPTSTNLNPSLYQKHLQRVRLLKFLSHVKGRCLNCLSTEHRVASCCSKLALSCYMERVDLSAHGFYATPNIGFDWTAGKGTPFNYYTYGAAFAEVEIDTLTGDFYTRTADIVMDLGFSINPAIDIGQIEGAFIQGLGWVAMEELKWGDENHKWIRPGHLFTCGPGSYKIPSVNDIPLNFKVSLLKGVPNPKAIHSSKAVGEPPFFLGSAVLFAIKDAIFATRAEEGHLDWFPLDNPATPERIRMACVDSITKRFAGVDYRPKLSV